MADYMWHDMRSVHKDAPIKEAGRLLQNWKVGSLFVDDGARYVGMMTHTDLSLKAVAKGLDPNATTVKGMHEQTVISIEDDEPPGGCDQPDQAQGDPSRVGDRRRHDRRIQSVSDILQAYAELTGLNEERAGRNDE